MPNIEWTAVERLRKNAVRGTLTPGLYRRVYAVPNQKPWYEDIYVETAHVALSQFSDEPTWFSYVNIDPTHFAYGRHLGYGMDKGSLRDAGVLPQSPERRNAKMCDLGHTHTEVIPAKYNCNFLVPLAKAVEVK